MTHKKQPIDAKEVKRLRAFGDALVNGTRPRPQNDIEATMVRVHRALSETAGTDTTLPKPVRESIWEDVMHTNVGSLHGPYQPSAKRLQRRSAPVITHSSPRPWARSHVPALLNIGLILVIVYGMVAVFTVQQPPERGSGNNIPVNQVLYDPEDISSFPIVPEKCVPNGVTPGREIPQGQSIGDWRAPEYVPAKMVTHEQGVAIQETFLAFQRCEQQDFDTFTPQASPSADEFSWSAASLSYFSDRMRYNLFAADLPAAQQEELEAFRCLPRGEQILASFPLPVNQPTDYAILELTEDNRIHYLQFIFAPSDVYLLPDGRFGAIMGTISPEALLNPNELRSDDSLHFVAFVEEGGRYYIDEMFRVLQADTSRPIVNRPEGSPPLTEVVYEPFEIPACRTPFF